MKILFITNNYTPYSGGVVSSINSSIDYLHACGHEVRIIAFQFLAQHDDPPYVVRVPSIHNWQYKKIYLTIPYSFQKIINYQVNNFKPDIIHVHHPFLMGAAALKSARKYNVPIIFTHHTQYDAYAHYAGVFSPIVRKAVCNIVKYFCNSVDHIIAPSSGVKNKLHLGGVITNITVLPSWLQRCLLPLKNPIIRDEVSRPIKLLYVGRLAPEKNVIFLFDMLIMLNIPFQLTIVGYGPDQTFLQKMAYCKYRFSEQHIIFIQKQSAENLIQFYRDADIFLFPSHTDTQGLVLAEAMAQARPIIAVRGIGQEDIIRQGVNGFIVSDATVMARKIELIASDKLLFVRLQRGAWTTAQFYSPDHLGKSLIKLYNLF